MKNFTFCLIILFISLKSYSQKDYYVVGSDTTRCSYLSYKLTIQSYLAEVSYKNAAGEFVVFKGRKNVPDITTIFSSGQIKDRVPQSVNSPESYVKWAERVVDGKLIVDFYHHTMTTYGNDFGGYSNQSLTSGITKFYIKMPDGTFYDIRKSKHMKKYIIPYLKECTAFTDVYKGDYSNEHDSFIEMIKLYNSVCK